MDSNHLPHLPLDPRPSTLKVAQKDIAIKVLAAMSAKERQTVLSLHSVDPELCLEFILDWMEKHKDLFNGDQSL